MLTHNVGNLQSTAAWVLHNIHIPTRLQISRLWVLGTPQLENVREMKFKLRLYNIITLSARLTPPVSQHHSALTKEKVQSWGPQLQSTHDHTCAYTFVVTRVPGKTARIASFCHGLLARKRKSTSKHWGWGLHLTASELHNHKFMTGQNYCISPASRGPRKKLTLLEVPLQTVLTEFHTTLKSKSYGPGLERAERSHTYLALYCIGLL